MEGNQVYIVIKILENGNFMKFGTPMATTNYLKKKQTKS